MNKHRVRILLIEDDEIDRMAVVRFVESEVLPYDLTVAKTVAEAMAQMQKGEFDLLLVDYSLPDGTGLEIQQHAAGIPCIYLTGVTEISIAVQVMQAGAYSYLVKDSGREYLKLLDVTIESALRRKREENELGRYRLHLEEEVQLRTVELREANDLLAAEISERVRVEEKFRIIFESALDAYYISDLKGTFIDGNKGAERITGYRKEELIGKSFLKLNLLPKNQLPKAAAFLATNALGKPTRPDEFTLIRKDGSEIKVEIATHPVKIEGKTLVLGIARDITERKRAEEAIQPYVRRLAALHKIDQAITSSLDLNVTLSIFLGHLLAQLEIDAAIVLRYQANIQTLEFAQGRGFRTAALQHTDLRLGQGYAGKVALQRRHIFIPDLDQADSSFPESPLFTKEGFAAYYGVPLIAKGKLVGVLEIFHRSALDPQNEWVDFLDTLANQAAIAIDNITLFNDLQRSNVDLILAYDATIQGWARTLELRDHETEGHSQRVVDLTLQLARKLGISEKQLVHVRRGALLHDIGKMGIPDKILQKPGPLTEDEWQLMHHHPVFAFEWLSPVEFLRPALEIPYAHHEKWDGTGYPLGLRGAQIPLAARIFAIVDVWDALKSDRPYRKAWPDEKVIAHIQEQSGVHFDPQVVAAFLEHIRRSE